jgi:diguanylate cyclase (GGDEF)-like protein
MWQADPATLRLQFITPGAEDLLGYSIEALLIGTEPWRSIVHPDDCDRVIESLRATAADGRDREIEFRACAANGATLSLHQVVRFLENESGVAELWGLTTDVTADVRAAEERASDNERYRALSAQAAEFRRQALQDALTGLPNRLLLNDRLGIALEGARRAGAPCAVLVMDLDRFKEVNDTQGHQAGDEVLRQVALRLRLALRAQDTAARVGGDEFAAVLPGTDIHGAIRAAQRIVRALRPPVDIEEHPREVGASIGVAMFPEDGETADELLSHADRAMYHAKKDGGGYALFDATSDLPTESADRSGRGSPRSLTARQRSRWGFSLFVAALAVSAMALSPIARRSQAPSGAVGRLGAAAVALAGASDEQVIDVVGTVETTLDEIRWSDVTEGQAVEALQALGHVLDDLRSEVATRLRGRVEHLIATVNTAETVARLTREASRSVPEVDPGSSVTRRGDPIAPEVAEGGAGPDEGPRELPDAAPPVSGRSLP